jgi:hypothetical protein
MMRRLGYVLTVLVATPALLVACSSSGGSGPTSPAPPVDTSPAIVTSNPPSQPAVGSGPASAPSRPTAPADATTTFDGNYTGYAYAPDEQPSQGEQLTFKVVNGAVEGWQSYMIGECTSVMEDLYIQGPSPIKSGVLTADVKVTPDPSDPGAYTNTSVIGTFDITKASGTVNYVAVGPCVEPPWNWIAERNAS